MANLSHRLGLHKWGRALTACALIVTLLAVAPPHAAAVSSLRCYCDPRTPPFDCWDDWTVQETATGFHHVVCNGAPPGTGGDVFTAPHPCPELAWVFTREAGPYYYNGQTENPASYVRQGNSIVSQFALFPGPFAESGCLPVPPSMLYGPNFIPMWPDGTVKTSLAMSLNVKAVAIAEFQQRLKMLPVGDPRIATIKNIIAVMMGSLGKAIQAFTDPPNPLYAQYPPLRAVPPYVPVVASGTLTPAVAAASNALVLAERDLSQYLEQLNATIDNVGGAIEAAHVGTPGAAVWVAKLARRVDLLGPVVAAKGHAMVNARAALAAASSSQSVPASCLTAADLTAHVDNAFLQGADPVTLPYYQQYALDNPCRSASTWPASFTANNAADHAMYDSVFGAVAYAARVCAVGGYCSAGDKADLNGDGTTDLVWRSTQTGYVSVALLNGTSTIGSGSPGAPLTTWAYKGQGDFNGDGKSDLLFQNTSGALSIWLMNGPTMLSSGAPAPPSANWTIQGIGDFDGDGKADILWRDSNSGTLSIWFMDGTALRTTGVPGGASSEWVVQRIGDFNGDGKADILWRSTASGTVSVWLMNGASILSSGVPGGATSEWVIRGVGDFDGDGKSDILWRSTTSGTTSIWFMSGTTIASSGVPGGASSDWVIQTVGDYDGNGKADVLWRQTSTGSLSIWFMAGATVQSQGSPGGATAEWVVQP
jgi:hypothetical protein